MITKTGTKNKSTPIPKNYRVVLTRWREDDPEPTVTVYDNFNGYLNAYKFANKHRKAKDVIVEIEAEEMFKEVYER